MFESGSLIFLLGTAAVISLSGVISPGPLTAIAITKGMQRKEAGPLLALGHAIVELPLILLIWLGFATIMNSPWTKMIVGVAGGIVLMWMGIGMIRTKPQAFEQQREAGYGCVRAGILASLANPYILIWWTTIGAALVMRATVWGLVGVLSLAVAHLLCDLGWLSFLSWGAFTSRRWFRAEILRVALVLCGVMLLVFGVYFMISGARFLSF